MNKQNYIDGMKIALQEIKICNSLALIAIDEQENEKANDYRHDMRTNFLQFCTFCNMALNENIITYKACERMKRKTNKLVKAYIDEQEYKYAYIWQQENARTINNAFYSSRGI